MENVNSAFTKVIISLTRNLPATLKSGFKYPVLEIGGQLDTNNHPYFKYYSISLSKVVYDKKMFHPGQILLTFSLNPKGTSPYSLQEALRKDIYQRPHFADLIGVKDNISVNDCTESDLVYVARNYYLQSHHVHTSSNGEHTVVVQCWSFDRKLSLSQYCKVYTGKCIATDVAEEEIQRQIASLKPHLETIIKTERASSNASSDADKVYFSDNPLSNISLDSLLMLGYQEVISNGKVYSAVRTFAENDKELKHPYLVQYNESFYDFLSRVLHRCGEFFYFEHGKINIGLPESTRKYIFETTEDKTPTVPADKHFSPLCSYSDRYSDETSEVVDSGILTYNGDYINTPASSPIDSSENYYDSQTTSDESLHVVTENDNRYHPFGMWILYKALGNLFTSDSFIMGIGYAGGYAAWDIINTLFVLPVFCVDPDYRKHHLDNGENVKDVNDLGEGADVSSIGADEIANLCNNYFRDIDRWEKTSAENLVSVNFESVLRQIYLGDTVCLDNLDGSPACVVVAMHGEYSGSSSTNTVEVVPITKLKEKRGGLNAVVTPVSGEMEHIRKVASMEAIVTDTRDPLRLGRVRVRYPWQPDNTEDKSPWLRVKVPFAGGTKERLQDSFHPGFCMTPGEGEHVMLDFVGGNIERPFVSGSFYYLSSDGETDHVPPLASVDPASRFYKTDHQFRTIASGKGHALVFQDLENTDLLSQAIPMAGALTQLFQIGTFLETGKYQANEVFGTIQGGSVTLKDGTGITTINLKPNEREIAINSTLGKVVLNAFTGININAPNGDVVIKGKNVTIQAGNNLSIQSGTNIQDGDSERLGSETLAGVLGMLGGLAICEGIACATGVNLTNVFDLSFLRSVVETALRPVEGTLCLRSKRNVVMTAGMGHVTLTSSMMSRTSTYTGKKSDTSGSKMTAFNELASSKKNDAEVDNKDYVDVRNFMAACIKMADEKYGSYRDQITELMSELEELNRFYNSLKWIEKTYWDTKLDYSTPQKIYDKIKNAQIEVDIEYLFPDIKKLEGKKDITSKKDLATLKATYDWYDTVHTRVWFMIEDLSETPFSYSSFINQCLKDTKVESCLKNVKDKEKIKSSVSETCDEILAKDLFSADLSKALFNEGGFNYSHDGVRDEVSSTLMKAKKYIVIKTLLAFSKVKIKKADAVKWSQQTQGGFCDSFDNDLKKMVKGELSWGTFPPLVVKNTKEAKNEKSSTTFWKSFGMAILNYIGGDPRKSFKKLVNYNGISGPRAFSDPGGNGNILISSDPGHFSVYDDSSNQWNSKSNPDPWTIKKYIATIDQSKK